MRASEWLREARCGAWIAIQRGDYMISGIVTGLNIDTEKIDVSTAGHTIFAPGRVTTRVRLDPWGFEVELQRDDTVMLMSK